MSRGVVKQAVGIVGPAAIWILIVATLLLPGCGASEPAATPTSSVTNAWNAWSDDTGPLTTNAGVNLPFGALEPAAPPETEWPPGIAMVLLSTGFKLYAVDRDGVRWSQEIQSQTEASAPAPVSFSGVAVSGNRQFIAYVEHRKDIVVRSLLDGAIISRTPYQPSGETQLRCVSSDGYFASLVSMQPPPQGTPVNRAFWRVTVLDLRTGEGTVQQPLEDLAKQRTALDPEIQFLLYSLDWLPEHRLLVNYAGRQSDTYSYDPGTGVMEPIPGMEVVLGISNSGTVYGAGIATATAPPKPEIWDGRTVQSLNLDAASAYASGGGAFNSRGDALAVLVSALHGESLGWQLFRLSQGSWQPAGPLSENTWMRESPGALSDDGTVVWSTLERSNGELVLLSHDFKTGVWKEWLAPESLPVHLDWYHIDAIIPESSQ
jgi:hypothetical protein